MKSKRNFAGVLFFFLTFSAYAEPPVKLLQNISSAWVEALTLKPCPADPVFSLEEFSQTAAAVFVESYWDLSDATLSTQIQNQMNSKPSFACKRGEAELVFMAKAFLNLKRNLLMGETQEVAGLIPASALKVDVLQYLAEETLFVLSQTKKGRFDHFWTNSKVMSGDVLISKGSAGSSAFLTRLGNRPAFYSHAAVLWRSYDDNKFYLPEAFIEDGVKLRDATQDYFPPMVDGKQSGKRRLSVYRLAEGTEGAGDWHYHLEKFSVDLIKNPLPYDFASDVHEHSKFTCLEVPIFLAKNASVMSPYPEAGWQKLTQVQKKFFKSLGSQIVDTLPVPQGIESSGKAWQWVGFSVDLDQLLVDRIDGILIDYFWQFLGNPKNEDFLKKVIQGIEQLSADGKLNSVLLNAAKNEGVQIPEGMNAKEAVFFGLLDKIVVVQVRKSVIDAHADFVNEFGRPMTLNDLEFFIRLNIQNKLKKWKTLFD